MNPPSGAVPAFPDPAHVALIARTEIRRRLRALRDNTAQLVSIVVAAGFGLIALLAVVFGAYVAGDALASGGVGDPVGAGGLAAAGLFLGVGGFVLFRRVQQPRLPDGAAGLLTTVPARDLHAGLLAVELTWVLAYVFPVTFVAAGAFAVGAGSALTFPAALLAVLGLTLLAVPAGFGLGLAVRSLFVQSTLLSRHRTLLGVAAFGAYMLLIVTGRLGEVTGPVVSAATVPPISWFGHLALAGLGGAALPAVGALLTVVLGAPLLLLGSGRAAHHLWYADPPAHGDDDSDDDGATLEGGDAAADTSRAVEGPGTLTAVLTRLTDRPTAAVTRKAWTRARRAPLKLIFVVYPAFGLVQPLADAVRTGTVPTFLVPLLALYAAWATGAALTLNPLGDEGAVLPVSLTTGAGGRGLVRGTTLAGAAVGVPVTALAVLVAGLLSPLSLPAVLPLAVVGAVLALCAPALAAGIGVAFPRFDAVRVTRSRRATVPSIWAFAAYSAALLAASLPGLVLSTPTLAGLVGGALGVGRSVVLLTGVGTSALLVGVAGLLSYRYAARSVGGYTL